MRKIEEINVDKLGIIQEEDYYLFLVDNNDSNLEYNVFSPVGKSNKAFDLNLKYAEILAKHLQLDLGESVYIYTEDKVYEIKRDQVNNELFTLSTKNIKQKD